MMYDEGCRGLNIAHLVRILPILPQCFSPQIGFHDDIHLYE